RTAAEVLTVELVDCGLRFGITPHLNEAEALATAGIAISDELRRGDGTTSGKLRHQVFFGSGERQITNVQLSAHETSRSSVTEPFKEESGRNALRLDERLLGLDSISIPRALYMGGNREIDRQIKAISDSRRPIQP